MNQAPVAKYADDITELVMQAGDDRETIRDTIASALGERDRVASERLNEFVSISQRLLTLFDAALPQRDAADAWAVFCRYDGASRDFRILRQLIAQTEYDLCDHKWVRYRQPEVAGGAEPGGEVTVFCEVCGAEKRDE